MSYNLTKGDREMIRAAGGTLDGAGMAVLEAGVTERLSALVDSGVVQGITRNHIRAAVTQELSKR